MYREAHGANETKKRQPPARINDRLRPILKCWREEDLAQGVSHVIAVKGNGIQKMRRAWARARDAAKLGRDVTPHVLRHTAITWALQDGVSQWDVAGWAGISVEPIDRVYGHHSPDYQRSISKGR